MESVTFNTIFLPLVKPLPFCGHYVGVRGKGARKMFSLVRLFEFNALPLFPFLPRNNSKIRTVLQKHFPKMDVNET